MSSIAAADIATETQAPPAELVEQTVAAEEPSEAGEQIVASTETSAKKKKKKKSKNLRAQNQGKPVVTLVVDTNPFVKGLRLDGIATKFVTVPEVVHELRSRASKDRFHELDIKHGVELLSPDAESMQIVCNFAKKTGDFASLAIADLKVIALAFMLEKKENGMRRLRTEPVGNSPNISDRKLLESAEIAGAHDDSDEDVSPEDVPANVEQSMAALTIANSEESEAPPKIEIIAEAADELCEMDAVADSGEAALVLESVANDDEFEVGSDEEFSDNEVASSDNEATADDDEGWQ
ncbi:20S-pre-rRNA D-site endonuclease nob1, partial [Coemansia furcata]